MDSWKVQNEVYSLDNAIASLISWYDMYRDYLKQSRYLRESKIIYSEASCILELHFKPWGIKMHPFMYIYIDTYTQRDNTQKQIEQNANISLIWVEDTWKSLYPRLLQFHFKCTNMYVRRFKEKIDCLCYYVTDF